MLVLWRSFSYTPRAGFRKEFSYTLRASFSEESLTLIMVVPVRCFPYTLFSFSHILFVPDSDKTYVFLIIVTTTLIRSQMLCLDPTKMQEQGLTGYSSVRLTSRASHRLGKCRLSWVWLGFGLLSALSECSAYLGCGSHRHASSGFVSVQTDQTAQSWHDLVHTSVFLFTINMPFSEEFLLHSSSWF